MATRAAGQASIFRVNSASGPEPDRRNATSRFKSRSNSKLAALSLNAARRRVTPLASAN
ncbi:MAG: hypothetical protein LBU23_01535 [Planctomycetota bacterium]|nr:hypothetical protein [Planctomycetota bacterium]